jgi:hypothetical protein
MLDDCQPIPFADFTRASTVGTIKSLQNSLQMLA